MCKVCNKSFTLEMKNCFKVEKNLSFKNINDQMQESESIEFRKKKDGRLECFVCKKSYIDLKGAKKHFKIHHASKEKFKATKSKKAFPHKKHEG